LNHDGIAGLFRFRESIQLAKKVKSGIGKGYCIVISVFDPAQIDQTIGDCLVENEALKFFKP